MKRSTETFGCVWSIVDLVGATVGAWYLMPWAYKMSSWSPWIAYPLLFLALMFALWTPISLNRFVRSVVGSYRINSIPFVRKYGLTKFATPLPTNLFLFLVFIVLPFAFRA